LKLPQTKTADGSRRYLLKNFEEEDVAPLQVCYTKMQQRDQESGKLADNSQNTLELKTEEWVSG